MSNLFTIKNLKVPPNDAEEDNKSQLRDSKRNKFAHKHPENEDENKVSTQGNISASMSMDQDF